MELLIVFRRVWRARYALALGVVGAAAVYVALGGAKLGTSQSALAWTRVMLDTPKSQTIAANPDGANTLNWRASLLMHVLATDDVNTELARRIGVQPHEVIVVDASVAMPEVPASLPLRASSSAAVIGAPYVLTAKLVSPSLAVIALEGSAPDSQGAQKLVQAALDVLASKASPGGPFDSPIVSGGGGFMARQPFTVEPVAPVRAKVLTEPVLPMKALAAAFAALGLWCAVVLVLVPAIARARRNFARRPLLE